MVEDILLELGFSKNEAKVYTALLRLGSSTATEISKQSKLHRTNVYDALERLVEKGLVSHILKDEIKYFEAADPETLMGILKEKEIQLREILPRLLLDKKLATKTKAHISEGLSAVKAVLNNFLEYKKPILVYGIPKEAIGLMHSFIIHYHKRRIEKKIPMKHIYNVDAQDRIEYLNTLPYTEAKYLPKEYNSPVSTNVCGAEVVLILWSKVPLVIQIESKEIADSYEKYFELLWGIAKSGS